MHNEFGDHSSKEVLIQAHSESERGPIVPVFHSLEAVTLEIYLAIEVHFIESLHWDLALAMVSGPILFTVEVEVVFHRPTWILGLFVLTRRN